MFAHPRPSARFFILILQLSYHGLIPASRTANSRMVAQLRDAKELNEVDGRCLQGSGVVKNVTPIRMKECRESAECDRSACYSEKLAI